MERVHAFDVIAAQREPEARIDVVERSTGAGLTLDAAALVAQYRFASGDLLLVLDEDVPFEEVLHLVFVRDGRILDHLVIGVPYAAGLYRELALSDDALHFAFWGDERFILTRPDRAGRSLPRGVRRRGRWFAPPHLSLRASGG